MISMRSLCATVVGRTTPSVTFSYGFTAADQVRILVCAKVSLALDMLDRKCSSRLMRDSGKAKLASGMWMRDPPLCRIASLRRTWTRVK